VRMHRLSLMILMAAMVLVAGVAQAVTIDLVPVGNPGNAADATGCGSVADTYLIGKYEITNAQWREFLTAKASIGDLYGLYSAGMGMDEAHGGIARTGSGTIGDPYVYTARDGDANWDNRPVNFVSL